MTWNTTLRTRKWHFRDFLSEKFRFTPDFAQRLKHFMLRPAASSCYQISK